MSTKHKQLTAEDIDAMAAGLEMDALVAEHIFGWQYQATGNGWWKIPGTPGSNNRVATPPYSTNIAAAWQVVEHTQMFDPAMGKLLFRDYSDKPPHKQVWVIGHQQWEQIVHDTEGGTPMLAICRAALKATLTP